MAETRGTQSNHDRVLTSEKLVRASTARRASVSSSVPPSVPSSEIVRPSSSPIVAAITKRYRQQRGSSASSSARTRDVHCYKHTGQHDTSVVTTLCLHRPLPVWPTMWPAATVPTQVRRVAVSGQILAHTTCKTKQIYVGKSTGTPNAVPLKSVAVVEVLSECAAQTCLSFW